jgi:hypothetical protein
MPSKLYDNILLQASEPRAWPSIGSRRIYDDISRFSVEALPATSLTIVLKREKNK